MDGLLNERDLCRFLSLSRSTVRAMVKAGDFPPPVQLGARRIAWRRDAVHEWVASRVPVDWSESQPPA